MTTFARAAPIPGRQSPLSHWSSRESHRQQTREYAGFRGDQRPSLIEVVAGKVRLMAV